MVLSGVSRTLDENLMASCIKKPAIKGGPNSQGKRNPAADFPVAAGGQLAYFMVGMTNSAPLARCGQRVVTVFSRV